MIETVPRLQHTFTIQSLVEHIYPVEQEILALARRLDFNDDECFCLRLAMDEAMVNAIIHGNKYEEDKKVIVDVHAHDETFSVCVRDEGNGYNFKALDDPTKEENLHCTHGRGIFLIRQFMSEVKFNQSGNQITFILHKSEARERFKAQGAA